MTANIEARLSIERVTKEWSELAGEPVAVERIGGHYYAFGSELACLRLAHRFRSFNVKYSENTKTWYFCNERRRGEETVS